MKSIAWRKAWFPLALVSGAVAAAAGVGACSSDDSSNVPVTGADGGPTGTPGTPGAAVTCANLPAGTVPGANCTIGPTSYCAADPAAVGAACGAASSACLALGDNTGKTTLDFRIRSLNVLAPAALLQLQNLVVSPNIRLKGCHSGSEADGQGGYNWLLRLDTVKNTITSGGAPPVADPIKDGYCFFEGAYHDANISPGYAPVTTDGNGTYTSSPQLGKVLYMPIFDTQQPTETFYVLPLSDPALDSLTLSQDKNCIGSLAGLNDPTTCQEWVPAGALSGYITLENADSVPLPQLGGQSLCSLLSGQSSPKCPRDPSGKIFIDRSDGNTASQGGDYCSVTKQAGGCGDSYWLSSTFTASAVKIDESGTQPHCLANNPASSENMPVVADAGAPSGDAAAADALGD